MKEIDNFAAAWRAFVRVFLRETGFLALARLLNVRLVAWVSKPPESERDATNVEKASRAGGQR
jgi:hypothetical protein